MFKKSPQFPSSESRLAMETYEELWFNMDKDEHPRRYWHTLHILNKWLQIFSGAPLKEREYMEGT
jgi:hypothetical protein